MIRRWNGMSKMKQRGLGTGVVRAGSLNMQYTNMKADCWKMYAALLLMGLVGLNGIVSSAFLSSWKSSRTCNFSKTVSCWRLRWSAQNAARPWRCASLKALWTSGADTVTGERRRKCAENQNTSGITLGSANYCNSVGNNACHLILCRSFQAKQLERVQAGETYCMWLDADLPRSDDWACGMLVWRNMRQREICRNGRG